MQCNAMHDQRQDGHQGGDKGSARAPLGPKGALWDHCVSMRQVVRLLLVARCIKSRICPLSFK